MNSDKEILLKQLERICAILTEFASRKVHGSFIVRFDNGKIVICKKEETIKI